MNLKPCPFCGGKAVLSMREEAECYEPSYYECGVEIACSNCHAFVIVYFRDDYPKTLSKEEAEQRAIKDWERRV